MHDAIFGIHSQPPVGRPVTRQPWPEEAAVRLCEWEGSDHCAEGAADKRAGAGPTLRCEAHQSQRNPEGGVGSVIWLASLRGGNGRYDPIMPDLERALINPAGVFGSPDEVVLHPLLSHACKREILGRWAWDELLIEIAHSEGMPGGPPSRLGDVKEALRQLGDEWHPRPSAPAARVLQYDLDPRLALAA